MRRETRAIAVIRFFVDMLGCQLFSIFLRPTGSPHTTANVGHANSGPAKSRGEVGVVGGCADGDRCSIECVER